MVNRPQLEKLLKDSYANYVVQTALDFAEESQHQKVIKKSMRCLVHIANISTIIKKLGECIRPLLPGIRNTSYCKRIQGKLNRDQRQPQTQQQNAQPYQQQPQNYFQTNYTMGGAVSGAGGGGGLVTGQGLAGMAGNIHPLMENSDLNSFAPSATASSSPFVGNVPHYNFSTTFTNP